MYAFIAADGGMAMRRKKSPTSVFLTALAIEVLAAGARPEWEYDVYIDTNVLNRLAAWLVKQQNMTSGAFLRTSHVFDLKMLVSDASFTRCSLLRFTSRFPDIPVISGD